MNRFPLAVVAFGLVLAASSVELAAKPRSPLPPFPESAISFHASFDEAYNAGSRESALVTDYGIMVEGWSGYGLLRDTNSLPPFVVPALSTDGRTNVNTESGGCIRFWVTPTWSSAPDGVGPQSPGCLAEMVTVSTTGANDYWALSVSADGSSVVLSGQHIKGGGFGLSAPIAWQAGETHLVALDYSPQGTVLFIDGEVAAAGMGVEPAPVHIAGLTLGSRVDATEMASCIFDELFAFSRPVKGEDLGSYYRGLKGTAALGPIISEEAERERRQNQLAQRQTATLSMSPMVSGPPSPGGGGGGGSTNYLRSGFQATNGLRFLSPVVNGTTTYLTLTGTPTNGRYGSFLLPGDILMTTNVAAPLTNWNWLCVGYTSNTYTFQNQPTNMAFYVLATPQKTMVFGWGNDSAAQCDVPYGLSNALSVAGGGGQSLALLKDGTVRAWGVNTYGQGSVPTNLVGVATIGAGWYHDVALLSNGVVTAWGLDAASLGWHLTEVPAVLTNAGAAIAISVQALHSLALRSDTTVVTWGYGQSGEAGVPAGLSNVVAISAGYDHNLAVKSDGTVFAWGYNGSGQCTVPSSVSNVVAVASGVDQSIALKSDGTVVAWGDTQGFPSNLSNVVSMAASLNFHGRS